MAELLGVWWHMDATSPAGETRTCRVADGGLFGSEHNREARRRNLIAAGWRCSEWRMAFGAEPDLQGIVNQKLGL